MKKQLIVAAGVLLSLGTAMSATLGDSSQVAKQVAVVDTASTQMGSKETAQIVALWKTHASSSGSIPLARPL
jgi:hypothetical protein